MNQVTLTDAVVRVEPKGLDKMWSFVRSLQIPFSHVRGATYDPGASEAPKGIRRPGLAVPGKWAGTFAHQGELNFWNVSDRNNVVVIQLENEKYSRLYLTVTNPRAFVDVLNAAVAR